MDIESLVPTVLSMADFAQALTSHIAQPTSDLVSDLSDTLSSWTQSPPAACKRRMYSCPVWG